MSELKRTQLYNAHLAAGATMVDFGGWEMPIQYPSGIVTEHLYTRHFCSLFDVSHMGRLLIEGPARVAFLQHVLSSNVQALDINEAQYCIIPNAEGGAIDDAYLYRFEADRYLLVVNAANTEKDLVHLREQIKAFDCTLTDISADYASIAVQGPKSREMLEKLSGGVQLTELVKNALGTVEMDGRTVRLAKTGYTGEPLGYEVFIKSEDAEWMWNRLLELDARPAGLGARDTLRMEAMLPLYGHEMGVDTEGKEIPIFSVPLAKFAVSFASQKGDFIGREPLARQYEAFQKIQNRIYEGTELLPRRMMPITLIDRGVMRKDMPIYRGEKLVGYVTSGTMVPYYVAEGEGMATAYTDETAKRALGLCLIDADIQTDDIVYVDIRGKRIKAVIPRFHMSVMAPPYARPLLYTPPVQGKPADGTGYRAEALELIKKAAENHLWRQKQCINLIPSENTPSRAVQMLCASDPAFRYAEHKKIAAFYDNEVFYYQGTKFIEHVEELLVE